MVAVSWTNLVGRPDTDTDSDSVWSLIFISSLLRHERRCSFEVVYQFIKIRSPSPPQPHLGPVHQGTVEGSVKLCVLYVVCVT